MSLKSVVNEVCAFVGVHALPSLFSNIANNRTAFEMLAVANEMAQRIAGDEREWQLLRLQQVFIGDGVVNPADNTIVGTEAFNLPNNYKRMLLTANVWRSTSTLHPMTFYPDMDEWLQRRASGYTNAWGEWTIFGGQMHIWPIMPVGTTARFAYLDENCVKLTGGGVATNFMADTDTFRLDERVLKLGMIWQWKALKGSPYAEDMATYMDALTRAAGSDKPSPIIIDRQPISQAATVSYPYPTPSGADWGWPLS